MGRVIAAAAGGIGVGTAAFTFGLLTARHVNEAAVIFGILFLAAVAALAGGVVGALLSRRPGWPRMWVTYGLLVGPWIFPGIAFARRRAFDRAVARCERFIGQPALPDLSCAQAWRRRSRMERIT